MKPWVQFTEILWVSMYDLFSIFGALVSIIVFLLVARRGGLSAGAALAVPCTAIAAGWLGAHVVFFLTELPTDGWSAATLSRIFFMGADWYGGLLGGIIVVVVYAKFLRLPILRLFDLSVPALALGQAVGRIGCFFAGCCYGKETTSVLGMPFPTGRWGNPLLHPTQLYDSAALFLVFILCVIVLRRSNRPGMSTVVYLLGSAAARFGIEFLRADNPAVRGMPLTLWQFVAMAIFFWGLAIYVHAPRKNPAS